MVLSGLAGLVSPDGSRDGAPGAALASGVAAASDRDPADAEREAATAGFLRELGVAFERGGARAARALAGPLAARRLAAAVARNVARLDVDGLDLRRVAEAPATADLVSRFGAATWVAEVEVVWRYAGIDRRSVSSTVELVLTRGEDGATLDDIRPAFGEQAPTWLLEPLTVRRRDHVRVAASDPTTASRLLAQAARAVTVVDRRLPAWRGDLVVEAPASVAGFRAASGLTPAAARSIAAVTTTADGATLPGSPERVFVNPEVFEPLGAAGQQIVISHEATHVAVDAAVSRMPAWLSEGFADWVALADSTVAVRVLATQALAGVRARGAPPHLPTRADFAAGNPDIGAAYESAWLAVRLLARTYGEAALLRFRRAADVQGSVDRAFRSTFGTSDQAFTRLWRGELVRLARG